MGPPARSSLTLFRPRREWLLVVVGALLLSAAVTWHGDAQLRSDQQAYNLLVARKLDPALLARDALYRHDPALLHVPWFLDAHAALARRLGGDVERALVWLTWPMGALYLAGHYALFRAATGRPLAAGLAAVGALTVRNALGGEFWGFDGVRSAATRTILAGLIPLLLLLFLAWRARRGFALFYLLLGALFNVHPVSAYHLAQATAVAHVVLARFRLRAIGQVLAGAGLFVVGALPYLVPFFAGRDDARDPATLALARTALDYRFPYLLYPIALDALLSVLFHVALLVAVWLWWRRRETNAVMAPLEVVMLAAVVLGLAGTAAIQALGIWLDRPYVDIQQLRMTRLVYPMLLTGLALAYARLLARPGWAPRAALAALFALSLVPPGSLVHAASEERRAAVKRALGMAVPPPAPPVAPAAVDPRRALWQWARATDPASLFLTDDFEFRVRTGRAVTGSYKDGALMFLAGTRPFTRWYLLDREVRACRAARGHACWFPLARRLDADYVVVDPGLAEAGTPPDFVRVWESAGWSVWRRAPARA